MSAHRLADLQPNLAHAITSQEDVSPDDLAELGIVSSTQVSDRARLQIYRRAYELRAVECLVEDFPRVAQIFGERAFIDLVRDYLKAYPSTSWTLADLGGDFPRYLAGSELASKFPVNYDLAAIFDLARLEWLRVLAEHAEEVEALTPRVLMGLLERDPDQLRLGLAPCTKIDRFDWAVHGDFEKRPTWLLVFRSKDDGEARELELTESRYQLLTELSRGLKLAEASERLKNFSPEEVSGALQELAALGLVTCSSSEGASP